MIFLREESFGEINRTKTFSQKMVLKTSKKFLI